MAYSPYFKDRLVQYPGRIKLTNVVSGDEMTCDVTRAEGTVMTAGTLLNATNMDFGTTLGWIQLDKTASPGTTDGDLWALIQFFQWNDVTEE